MTHTPETRRKNCIKLLLGLTDNEFETKFEMGAFATDGFVNEIKPSVLTDNCGTSACLLGHGPLCGVSPTTRDEKYNWWSYRELFINESLVTYDFLFCTEWPDLLSQGRARIHRLLQKGVPSWFNQIESIYRLPKPAEIAAYRVELEELEKDHE